jgi:hypothetical protein
VATKGARPELDELEQKLNDLEKSLAKSLAQSEERLKAAKKLSLALRLRRSKVKALFK